MPGEIKIPGVGPVKKQYVYIAGAGIAAVVGYAYWTSRQGNAGAAGSPAEGASGDDTTGLEPAGPGDYIPGTDYQNPIGGGTGSSGSTPDTETPPITDNVSWSRAAVAALVDVEVPLASAAAAVGRYMAGLTLTPAEADLIRQAQALVGTPPVGDHPIKVAPTGSTPKPADTPSGASLPGPGGLKVAATTKTTVTLTWNKVKGADYYRIYRADVSTNVGSSQDGRATVGGLSAGHSYKFHVRAVGHDGKFGKPSSTVSVKTKK